MFNLSDLDSLTIDIPTLQSSLASDSLSEFIRQSWSLVEPANPLVWNWHLDEYCSVLEDVYYGRIKRLIVNVPPGTSKSLFFSVFFNAWAWTKDPSKRFLTASYSIDLTLRDNRRLRDIVKSDWYKSNFHVELSSDQSAKERFETTRKGWRIATSVGGVGTGEHPHFLIIDDPLKASEANSEAERKKSNDWISNTVSTRKALDPAIILVMQRLHEDDPSGFLLQKGGWTHFCLPMRFESHKVDAYDIRDIPSKRDHRVVDGELLFPQVWSKEKVDEEELLLGLSAAGQLGQRPVPEGGALFERSWFEFVDQSPIDARRCRGWDIAETDAKEINAKRNNWTVGTRIAEKSGVFYVEHNTRAQLTIVDDLIKSTAILDGKKCKIREGRGSGKATIKARSILLAGYDYDFSPETDSKVQRANPFRSQAKAGNVKIVKADWNEIWLNVICSFPFGSCDDDVDSSSNAFNELAGTGRKKGKLTW